jgi:hypothetical protein
MLPCGDPHGNLSPSGKGWRVENLSRTYSRLSDLAGLLCISTVNFPPSTFSRSAATQRYMHLDEHELADAQDLVE